MEKTNITIIGAGVVGLAIASNLSKEFENVMLIERHNSFGQETSSRNSEVIHAGIYYPQNFLKGKLCLEGNEMMYDICKKYGIPHKNTGKLVIAAKNLKSEKGSMMNNKAYKALKADEQPNITFTAASLPVGKTNVNGRLTIAGVTKTISLPVNVVKNGNSYNITGTETLKMSDYGMETPGFLGVHTGDAVTVTVNVVAN